MCAPSTTPKGVPRSHHPEDYHVGRPAGVDDRAGETGTGTIADRDRTGSDRMRPDGGADRWLGQGWSPRCRLDGGRRERMDLVGLGQSGHHQH